ncbi:hypothetical protein F5Y06DRAFT_262705 [Hypoxylon sp. FL0890]|nr:hypothetical protein F5Y06DRAFT_262705 [Hypoxylon sp. FL0890]
MHFNNKPYSSALSQKWDPETVLELANQDFYGPTVTCMGWATSRNRRCQRVPAQHKIMSARGILNRLAGKSASKAAESSELREAAELLLCWQHTSQLAGLLRRWRIELEDWAADQEDDNFSSATPTKLDSRASSTEDKPQVKKEAAENLSAEELRKMMKEMQENLARLDAELQRRGRNHTKSDCKQEEEEKRFCEEQRRRQEEETKRRQEEEKRRQEEEKKRKEAEERRRKQEEENKRKEEEAKRKEEAREKAYRERLRAFREKVRLEKEERDRQKKEKEAAEWRAAWKHYSDAWDKSTNVSVANMPWPVKSGLRSDVNEANVKLFFAKAPPEESVNSGDKRFKLINAENKRWHTDKVMQRFGPDAVNGDAKLALDIIAKVVVELRQEARKRREL